MTPSDLTPLTAALTKVISAPGKGAGSLLNREVTLSALRDYLPPNDQERLVNLMRRAYEAKIIAPMVSAAGRPATALEVGQWRKALEDSFISPEIGEELLACLAKALGILLQMPGAPTSSNQGTSRQSPPTLPQVVELTAPAVSASVGRNLPVWRYILFLPVSAFSMYVMWIVWNRFTRGMPDFIAFFLFVGHASFTSAIMYRVASAICPRETAIGIVMVAQLLLACFYSYITINLIFQFDAIDPELVLKKMWPDSYEWAYGCLAVTQFMSALHGAAKANQWLAERNK